MRLETQCPVFPWLLSCAARLTYTRRRAGGPYAARRWTVPELTQSTAWQALQAHAAGMGGVQMRDLFAREPERFVR